MKKRWPEKPLGDVCCIERKQARHKGIPYVGLEHIESGTGKFVGTLSPTSVKSNTFAFTAGSVLFGRLRPYLKKVLLPTFAGHCSTEIFPLRPSEVLASEYLVYWLLQDSVIDAINGTCTGARMPRANMDAVMDFAIPVPPLHEQRRIVAILDEAFEGIAAAKANAENTLRNVTGLLEQWLDSTLTQPKADWRDVQLADVCDVIRGSSPRPIKRFFTDADNGVNWVKIADATRSGKYISETAQKITPKGAEKSRQVFPGDLLLTNSMSYGHPFIMATDGYVHDGWFVLRNYSDVFDSEFFYAVLTSKVVQRQFGVLAAGSVVKNISSDLVKKARLPIPPKKEQVALAKIFLSLQEQGADYEAICRSKIAALDQLKASLLHQAFTGQL